MLHSRLQYPLYSPITEARHPFAPPKGTATFDAGMEAIFREEIAEHNGGA